MAERDDKCRLEELQLQQLLTHRVLSKQSSPTRTILKFTHTTVDLAGQHYVQSGFCTCVDLHLTRYNDNLWAADLLNISESGSSAKSDGFPYALQSRQCVKATNALEAVLEDLLKAYYDEKIVSLRRGNMRRPSRTKNILSLRMARNLVRIS